MKPFSIRALLADDHPAILLGIKQALADAGSITIVGEATNSSDLIRQLERTPCDVLVTDYAMPGGDYSDGAALLTFIGRRFPQVRIVVITMMNSPGIFHNLIQNGITSIVSKSDDTSHVLPAIHAAFSGARYTSPTVSDVVRNAPRVKTASSLSQRESEVIRLFVSGLTIGEIAEQLNRSKQTVSTQKTSAMRKLGLQKDADIYKYATEVGLDPQTSRNKPE